MTDRARCEYCKRFAGAEVNIIFASPGPHGGSKVCLPHINRAVCNLFEAGAKDCRVTVIYAPDKAVPKDRMPHYADKLAEALTAVVPTNLPAIYKVLEQFPGAIHNFERARIEYRRFSFTYSNYTKRFEVMEI